MCSGESPQENLKQILQLWGQLESPEQVDMLCLPENSLYNRIQNSSRGLSLTDDVFVFLQKFSDDNDLVINMGALPLKEPEGISNATLIVKPLSPIEVIYRKIHLFDIDLGHLKIRESDQFIAGNKPSFKEYLNWNMGFSICYDLRFSELFKYYSQNNADIIFAPSAFTRLTGKAHWQTLVRARAIENQCYLVAAAQTGTVYFGEHKRESYGHSMVVDPWGTVLCLLESEKPDIKIVSLSKKLVDKTKSKMPINQHRKLK